MKIQAFIKRIFEIEFSFTEGETIVNLKGEVLPMYYFILFTLTSSEKRVFWNNVIDLAEPFIKSKTNGEAKSCYENNGKFYDLQIYCKFKYNIFRRVDILVFEEISEDEFLDKVIEYKKINRK